MDNKIKEEYTIHSKNDNRPFLVDVRGVKSDKKQPAILLTHGFKGFKDWGHFNLMADKFVNEGFIFFKFNVSHNGTTVDDPHNFGDLEAFAHNNFTKELNDVESMVDHIYAQPLDNILIDTDRIFLIGHSRGGGVSLIHASEDKRIRAVVTWAALINFRMGFTDQMIEYWKKNGVHHIENARTNQKMPIYFQAYEDLQNNSDRLNPVRAIQHLDKPALVIHGNNDETVPVSAAHELKRANTNIELHIIENGNHVFGGTHPFDGNDLHPHAEEVFNKTVSFFQKL